MSMFYHACEHAYARYHTTDCSKLPKAELHALEAAYAREYPENISEMVVEDNECEQGEAWAAFLGGERTRATLRTLLGVMLRVQSREVLSGIHDAINQRLESAREMAAAWNPPHINRFGRFVDADYDLEEELDKRDYLRDETRVA